MSAKSSQSSTPSSFLRCSCAAPHYLFLFFTSLCPLCLCGYFFPLSSPPQTNPQCSVSALPQAPQAVSVPPGQTTTRSAQTPAAHASASARVPPPLAPAAPALPHTALQTLPCCNSERFFLRE